MLNGLPADSAAAGFQAEMQRPFQATVQVLDAGLKMSLGPGQIGWEAAYFEEIRPACFLEFRQEFLLLGRLPAKVLQKLGLPKQRVRGAFPERNKFPVNGVFAPLPHGYPQMCGFGLWIWDGCNIFRITSAALRAAPWARRSSHT